MIIVSDSSPLIVLAKIGQLNLLPIIYTTVLITPRVAAEITSRKRPLEDRIVFDPLPEWMLVKSPIGTMSLSDLDPGEAEAILLATELGADALLIDDKRGRREAKKLGITVVGTLGILEAAADLFLVDLSKVFNDLKSTNFRISHSLLEKRLVAFQTRQPST